MIFNKFHNLNGCFPFLKGTASLFIFLFVSFYISAQTITVKQDGSGDYTVIQNAVNAASDGDTVLVYPGTYFENVDITDKGIVLASTWILNQVDSIINQTIIDGNQTGSCIKSFSSNQWTEITGLTLQNGIGTKTDPLNPETVGTGGGIFCEYSLLKISECQIKDNFASTGGGIESVFSSLDLSHNTIKNNWTLHGGGGLAILYSNATFDSLRLNNVFLNYSHAASDIAIGFESTILKIWLDTSTVLNPDCYYISKIDDVGIQVERPPISVLHGIIEQVNSDLYVSPEGNDTNSGLSPGDPLKTIAFALLKISSDSVSMKTVHVADGIYSHSLTGEHTPLQLKNYVNLVGESMENTIIDCKNKYEGARFAFGQDYTCVKKMSFQNGNGATGGSVGGFSSGYSKKLVLDSVSLINATSSKIIHGIVSYADDTLIIKNSLVKDCKGVQTIVPIKVSGENARYVEFNSTRFEHNGPDLVYDSTGGHITILYICSTFSNDLIYSRIINCLFNDNLDSIEGAQYPGATCLDANGDITIDILNSTIVNNVSTNPWGGAIGATLGSDVNFYNCILYGNRAYQVYLGYNSENQTDTMGMYYSLVENGHEGIVNYGPFNQVLWGDGNLDDDPLFIGSGDYPYAIGEGSPCIDAGTTELPPGITLPEHDLAGNPRVWGSSVDMGAYEYGPWVKVPSVGGQRSAVSSQISVSPNPFAVGTYVNYEMKEEGVLDISVFSLSGSKVRTLVSSRRPATEKGRFYWDGSNFAGNRLKPGTYVVRMAVNGKVVESEKVVVSE